MQNNLIYEKMSFENLIEFLFCNENLIYFCYAKLNTRQKKKQPFNKGKQIQSKQITKKKLQISLTKKN